MRDWLAAQFQAHPIRFMVCLNLFGAVGLVLIGLIP